MKKIKAYLLRRIKSDAGASNTIEFLVAIVFLLMFSVTILDMGFYTSNRTQVTNAAQNGARLAAVYGGTGGENGTPIAQTYGSKKDKDCKVGNDPVSCAVEAELRQAQLVNVVITGIDCGPKTTEKIGMRTYCQIDWISKGIPGSASSFIKRNPENVTRQTAESEVIVDGN